MHTSNTRYPAPQHGLHSAIHSFIAVTQVLEAELIDEMVDAKKYQPLKKEVFDLPDIEHGNVHQ